MAITDTASPQLRTRALQLGLRVLDKLASASVAGRRDRLSLVKSMSENGGA